MVFTVHSEDITQVLIEHLVEILEGEKVRGSLSYIQLYPAAAVISV